MLAFGRWNVNRETRLGEFLNRYLGSRFFVLSSHLQICKSANLRICEFTNLHLSGETGCEVRGSGYGFIVPSSLFLVLFCQSANLPALLFLRLRALAVKQVARCGFSVPCS